MFFGEATPGRGMIESSAMVRRRSDRARAGCLGLVLAGVALPATAMAADAAARSALLLCSEPAAPASALAVAAAGVGTGGDPQVLAVLPDDGRPRSGCRTKVLPVAPGGTRWLGVGSRQAVAEGRRITLVRAEGQAQVGIEIEPAPGQHRRTSPPATRPAAGDGTARAELPEAPAAWVWDPNAWRLDGPGLIAWARRNAIATLNLSVMVDGEVVRDAAALAAFVAQAQAAGIAVVAVEGDPDMISDAGQRHAVARAQALAAYQAAWPGARLAGLQYDIEPYVAAGFSADPAGAWRRWSETLTVVAAALGERIDVVVPFWILESPGGADALAAVLPALRRLTIMAYRTDPAAIIGAAAPVLSWAGAQAVATTVALETGPLPREHREIFEPAREGTLQAIDFGDVTALVLFDRPLQIPDARAFRHHHSVETDPRRITFAGDRDRLAAAVAVLTRDLAAWPAARGIAIHGLEVAAAAAALSPSGGENAK
jgi:hypothetical protein